jgi:ketosteroid isomerase-like protein
MRLMTLLCAICSAVLIIADYTPLEGREVTMQTAASSPTMAADLETLARLNEAYIEAVRQADAVGFESLLAADFLCTMADGSFLDRAQFLDGVAKAAKLPSLQAHDVNIRVMGDVAIIHARTTFELADGMAKTGRYTDIWAKRDGRWQAVAAHVNRKQ